MGKKLMKNLVLLCAVIVLCFAVSTMASALDENGQCGENVYWIYDSTTGELVISGSGEMYDYSGLTGFPDGSTPFYNSDIKEVIIEEGVTSIGGGTFHDCFDLESISIPASVSFIGNIPFRGTIRLKEIIVNESSLYFSVDEYGVLYNKDKTVLIKYPTGSELTSCIVASSTITIAQEAFSGAINVEEVVLPEGLLYIGYGAFEYCISLNKFALPDSLLTLDDGSLTFCMGLTELTVPEKVIRENYNGMSIAGCMFMDKLYVESMDCRFEEFMWYMNCSNFKFTEISREQAIELMKQVYIEMVTGEDTGAYTEFESYIEYIESDNIADIVVSTIYCHSGSTVEALAIEYGFEYELTHFFKGEWTYDYDNMIRTRKCIHCDELETEDLKTASDNGVEVIVPGTDTKVEVEVVDKNSDNYILVENKLSETIDSNFKILKVFDINLKNNEGVHVKADGTVKVKLPLDWEKDGDYKVYRLNDDGTLTDMNAYRQGSHMIFDTDHFSIYVIVEENVQEEAPEVTPDEEKKDDLYAKILDWFRSLLDLILRLFNI